MFRAIVFIMALASLSGCAPPTPPTVEQQMGQAAINNARVVGTPWTSMATAREAAPGPTIAVRPEPQVIYVPQSFYMPSRTQSAWGAARACGLVGNCGRSALGRGVDVSLNRDNCTSRAFGNTVPVVC